MSLVCALVLPLAVLAQNRSIKGKVTDAKTGETLIGVAVKVQNTSAGTTTDLNGNFELNIGPNATLEISYVGYDTKTVTVGTQNEITVSLNPNSKSLDEVVVIGYGTAKKSDLTGSIVSVSPDKIANENPKTVQDILRGTPGLNVGYNASAKGGGSLQIRGQNSLYDAGNHNSPLLILDGMIFYGELSEINPDDIEKIDILKDASAAAVYGSQAASGVIIITTKKGKPGKPVVNITSNIGATELSDFPERFSPESYMNHRQDFYESSSYGINPQTGAYEAYQKGTDASKPYYYTRPDQLPSGFSIEDWRAYTGNNNGQSDLSIWAGRLGLEGSILQNYLDGRTVNWADKAFGTGFNKDFNGSVSGASDKVNYYLSAGYLKNEGTVVSDQYQAIRANMKVNGQVNKWLELGANVNFQDRSDGNLDIDLAQTLRNSPFSNYSDDMGNPTQFPLDETYSQRGYNYDFQRQYLDLEKGYTVLNTIFNSKVKLPFNITYTFNYAPRFQFFYDRYFSSAALPGSLPADRGVNREQAKKFDWSLNNTINWEYTLAKKHRFNVTLVQEAEERQSWQDRIEARNILPSDALGFHNTKNGGKEDSGFSSSDSRQTANALLGRIFYSYDNRYMLTASVRRDGYSAFGTSNPYATFPSMAVAWTFTNEKFFKWNDLLSNGKLRLSYGKNGNRSLADPYLALANLSAGGGKLHGYINSKGELEQYRYLYADRLANSQLRWEKTASFNFGLDFGFLNNRISGSVDYYRKKTEDMILNQRLPSFTGFSSITTNLGQVDNNGVDVALNSVNIRNDLFQWNTTVGISYNKNKIVHIDYSREDIKDAQGNVIGSKEKDDQTNGWFIGQPISTIWDYKVTGIWQVDEYDEARRYDQFPGDPKIQNTYTEDDVVNADGSITPVYNNKDKVFIGQTTPPLNWSLRNEFVFKNNLTLSFSIYSFMGHKSLESYYLNNDDDGGRLGYGLQNVVAKEYWTPDNPTNKYGRIQAKGSGNAGGARMDYNRSFIRLDNISVGYTLPKKWTSRWDLSNVKVFGTVRNVANWSNNWEYGDPETGSWASRVYNLGLNLVF